LIYALHIDSDLDVEQIYRSLTSNPELRKTTMSVAEKLIAKGLEKGLKKGQSKQEALCAMDLAELEALHQQLHREYKRRFK
jgi:flagellar biosynthesis/type III secretory pathway protein FliH